MPFGAEIGAHGVRFRLWAPAQQRVLAAIEGGDTIALQPAAATGWHEVTTDRARPGDRYSFVLDDGLRVPDPASRFQPDDCHGPSEIIDPDSYLWQDAGWQGRPWHEAVIYELHVGTFTPEGTFAAAARKLPALAALGVTAVQLMPIGDFPGGRNWGYDGVLPYAPDASYGRPEDLKAFVDVAHHHGLMVFLDVVYNHFGPDGNYLGQLAPSYVTERHHTPWGAALNFDGPGSGPMRAFVIHNALYWIEEYHLDGLRLDAVHEIRDDSEEHLLVELSRRVHAAAPGRAVHITAENEENRASLLRRDGADRPLALTAQWNDDIHHVLHAAITGERDGYYADYADDPATLRRAVAEGFVFQGEVMPYRGSPRGERSDDLPATAFVSFLQNHDQVGNRALGERIVALAPERAVRAAAALYLLAPQIPMLFMGEEWGATSPFCYFCDFTGELAISIRAGRRREFARFPAFRSAEARERIPDPTAVSTFDAAKLAWDERRDGEHAAWLDWYTAILAVRRTAIVPRLAGLQGGAEKSETCGHRAVRATWRLGDGSRLTLWANLSAEAVEVSAGPAGDAIWTEGEVRPDVLGPWSVGWWLDRGPHEGG